MHIFNQQVMLKIAKEKFEQYEQTARMARAVRLAYSPQRSILVKARNYTARLLHKMAEALATDKPISAYDRA